MRKSKTPSPHEILLRTFPSCALARQPSSTTTTTTAPIVPSSPHRNNRTLTLAFEQSQESRMRADIEASQIESLREQLVELYIRLRGAPVAVIPTLPVPVPARIRRQTAGCQTVALPVLAEISTATEEWPRGSAMDELMAMVVLPGTVEEARYNVLLATERHGALLGSWDDLSADGAEAARALGDAHSLRHLTEVRMRAVLQEMLYALHKPCSMTTTTAPRASGACMGSWLRSLDPSLYPVGRLDRHTSGLLLATNIGKLCHHLLTPGAVPKTYLATTNVCVTDSHVGLLRGPIHLSDGVVNVEAVEVVEARPGVVDGGPVSEGGPTRMSKCDRKAMKRDRRELMRSDPDAYDAQRGEREAFVAAMPEAPMSRVRLTLRCGRNRVVRRLMAACGLPVVALLRERVGHVSVGEIEVGAAVRISEAVAAEFFTRYPPPAMIEGEEEDE